MHLHAWPLTRRHCREEEEAFSKTLQKGIALFEKQARGLKKGDILSGEIAFQLYDTYGFPLDLTQVDILLIWRQHVSDLFCSCRLKRPKVF